MSRRQQTSYISTALLVAFTATFALPLCILVWVYGSQEARTTERLVSFAMVCAIIEPLLAAAYFILTMTGATK